MLDPAYSTHFISPFSANHSFLQSTSLDDEEQKYMSEMGTLFELLVLDFVWNKSLLFKDTEQAKQECGVNREEYIMFDASNNFQVV
jgi:hypothetical protein